MNLSGISSQISQNIFSKLDTEGQGYLSQEVLSSAFESLNSNAADSDAETLVGAMDSDSDGQITKSELTQGIENLLSQLGKSQQRPPMGGLGGMASMGGMPPPSAGKGGEGLSVTAEQAAALAETADDQRLSEVMTQVSDNFSEMDADEDGLVNREEVIAFNEAQREARDAELNSRFDLAAMENVAKLIAAYGLDLSETDSTVSTTA